MTTEHAKTVLSEMIKAAVEYDRTGNVVLRDQTLRNISDLPLPKKYIDTALEANGLK